MPLRRAGDFGTRTDGARVNDYCRHCYRNGRFTEPGITEAQMVEKCVAFVVRQTMMTQEEARSLMSDVIPSLKRWREGEAVA
jgi:hypothetical protein